MKIKFLKPEDILEGKSGLLKEKLLGRILINFSQESFKEKFNDILGKNIDIVSTSDHIFASPPLRILDSYKKMPKENLCIFLYDINRPNSKKYRVELNLDYILYGAKNSENFIFSSDFYPYASEVNTDGMDIQKEKLEEVLYKAGFKEDDMLKIMQRIQKIIEIYKKSYEEGDSSGDFYKKVLTNLLSFLNFNEHAKFIENNMESFYQSGFIQNYLPYAIIEEFNTPFCIKKLIEDSNYFSGTMFYGTKNGKISVNIYTAQDFLNSPEKIIEGLKFGNILPSTKLIVWGLAIAGIKHFGNDYGLFQKLSIDLNNNGFDNNINELQITGHREDGKDFLSFPMTYIYI